MELLKNRASSGGLVKALIISVVIHVIILLFIHFGSSSVPENKQAFYVRIFQEISEKKELKKLDLLVKTKENSKKEESLKIVESINKEQLPEEGSYLSYELLNQLISNSKYVIAKPLSLYNVKPTYPLKAKRQGIEGRVAFKLKISSTGRIVGYNYVSSGHLILDKAAIEHIMKLHFFPGTVQGKIYGMTIDFVVNYKLV